MSIYLQLKDRYKEAVQTDKRTVYKTEFVNRLTGWQRFWMRVGQIMAAAAAVVVAWKLLKR